MWPSPNCTKGTNTAKIITKSYSYYMQENKTRNVVLERTDYLGFKLSKQ